ncbi:DUF1294 domain-containing protein [Psychromonas sp. MB-3u-54]|uniref:DUF1294 domain-containing protein n=1 Tax=Psychromonas sp. MB-3u-54 TaxID=2058319 RepID=UPI000C31DC2F|nr:cold shock and DUF1294 domain-containing protein [Psychromonas sp. MB-3u-54]PKH03139.1 DUF1294 domain-containing protein [Psychromonas sp. MB-3u-54]
MKLQGKVTNWNDDKGFGFVEPNGGGVRAFVHIKAFNPSSRRPVNGEIITYELVSENNNRYKAKNIKFSRDINSAKGRNGAHRTNNRNKRKSNILGSVLTVLFCIGLLISIFNGKVPVIVGFAYIMISLMTILVYAKDKYSAQNNSWRTPEATLHFFSLIGGWPGALFAQKKLRHKTSKNEFIKTYRITVFLNVGVLLVLYTAQGQHLLHNMILPLLNG